GTGKTRALGRMVIRHWRGFPFLEVAFPVVGKLDFPFLGAIPTEYEGTKKTGQGHAPPRKNYGYFIFLRSLSTFLNPAGTLNWASSTPAEEKLLSTVVISSRDPDAVVVPAPEFADCCGASGEVFFLPNPNRPP